MKIINFDEPSHKYTNDKGERYVSATQFLEKFVEPFEKTKQFWLYYKAVQYLSDIDKPEKIKKYDNDLDCSIGRTVFNTEDYNLIVRFALGSCNYNEELLIDFFDSNAQKEIKRASEIISSFWDKGNKKSLEKGTIFHNWKEGVQLADKTFEYGGVDIDVFTEGYTYDISKLEPMTYPEMRLWNHEFKLAGMADQIIILPGKKAIIRDWKTNLEIKTSNKYKKMKYPVEHLDDCNLSHYTLQLSLYAWMLEQFGYEVIHLEVEHFELEEIETGWKIVGSKIYPLHYLKSDIINMLEYNRNEL